MEVSRFMLKRGIGSAGLWEGEVLSALSITFLECVSAGGGVNQLNDRTNTPRVEVWGKSWRSEGEIADLGGQIIRLREKRGSGAAGRRFGRGAEDTRKEALGGGGGGLKE